jgi:hypothetical protein
VPLHSSEEQHRNNCRMCLQGREGGHDTYSMPCLPLVEMQVEGPLLVSNLESEKPWPGAEKLTPCALGVEAEGHPECQPHLLKIMNFGMLRGWGSGTTGV